MPDLFLADEVADAALNFLKTNATELVAVSLGALGPTWANVDANRLGEVTLASGDFTVADRTGSGRKVQVAAKNITVDADGVADAVALTNGADTVYAVRPLSSSVPLETGWIWELAAFDLLGSPDAAAV